jgi:hypothetical protein
VSFAISAAVAGADVVAGAAPVVDGAVAVGGPGTASGGLGASSDDGVEAVHPPDIAHHTNNANAAAAITFMKSRSMVASTHAGYITRHSGKGSKENLGAAHAGQQAYRDRTSAAPAAIEGQRRTRAGLVDEQKRKPSLQAECLGMVGKSRPKRAYPLRSAVFRCRGSRDGNPVADRAHGAVL